jgi:hypothetical protein
MMFIKSETELKNPDNINLAFSLTETDWIKMIKLNLLCLPFSSILFYFHSMIALKMISLFVEFFSAVL